MLILPGALHWLVVARLPLIAAHQTALDVVPHQLLGILGRLPGHDHRGVRVPGGDNSARRRRDICRPEPEPEPTALLFVPATLFLVSCSCGTSHA